MNEPRHYNEPGQLGREQNEESEMDNPRKISDRVRDESADPARDGAGRSADLRAACDPAEAPSKGPFGGLSPSEAALRKHEQERERKAEREANAELDRLTVLSRFSTALARKATYAELEKVVAALISKAQEGNVQAAKLLLDYVQVLVGSEDDVPADLVNVEDMTPEQRASLRAQLLREMAVARERAANEGQL
jgi:hypothetical protein